MYVTFLDKEEFWSSAQNMKMRKWKCDSIHTHNCL